MRRDVRRHCRMNQFARMAFVIATVLIVAAETAANSKSLVFLQQAETAISGKVKAEYGEFLPGVTVTQFMISQRITRKKVERVLLMGRISMRSLTLHLLPQIPLLSRFGETATWASEGRILSSRMFPSLKWIRA